MNIRKKNVLTRKGIALLILSMLCMYTGLICGDVEPVVFSSMIFCYFLYNVNTNYSKFKINVRRKISQKEALECDFVRIKTVLECNLDGKGNIGLEKACNHGLEGGNRVDTNIFDTNMNKENKYGLENGNRTDSVVKKGIGEAIVEGIDILDKKSRIRGSNRIFANLKGKREIEYTLEVKKRGRYTIGPLRYRIYDKAGLSFEDAELEIKDEVIVYPKIEEIKNALVESGFYRHYPGEYITRQSGSSTEFRTIRDYVRGDPIKRINWKASRRFNKWMVNEYERDNICDVVMFLDAREVSKIGTPLLNPLENSIRALVAIAAHLIKSHNHVGLVVYSDTVYTLTPSGGNAQLQRILSVVTFVEGKGDTRFVTALENAEGYLSPKTGILLFSSLDYDPTIRNALYRLNAKGYEVTIISPSSIDFERVFSGYVCERYKMVRMERDNLLRELAGYAKIIDWMPGENIQSMLKRCFDE